VYEIVMVAVSQTVSYPAREDRKSRSLASSETRSPEQNYIRSLCSRNHARAENCPSTNSPSILHIHIDDISSALFWIQPSVPQLNQERTLPDPSLRLFLEL
jgi:hypothetical protein